MDLNALADFAARYAAASSSQAPELLASFYSPDGSLTGYEEWSFGPDNLIQHSKGHYDEALYPTDLGGGVLEAVMSAGRLPLISNQELRFKLAAWGGVFGEVLDDEIMGREYVIDKIIPYFIDQGAPLSQAWNDWEKWPIAPRTVTADPAAFERILTDPRFQTILEGRYVFWAHTTREYRAALEAIDGILEEIDRSH